jgi:hypothetical protein
MSPVSSVKKKNLFREEVRRFMSAEHGILLETEVAIEIGSPPRIHEFDLANLQDRVVVECRRYKWKVGGHVPNGKFRKLLAAVSELENLSGQWTRVLAMYRSMRGVSEQSLAEYFVQKNEHLLSDVVVVEVADGKIRVLHGPSLGGK